MKKFSFVVFPVLFLSFSFLSVAGASVVISPIFTSQTAENFSEMREFSTLSSRDPLVRSGNSLREEENRGETGDCCGETDSYLETTSFIRGKNLVFKCLGRGLGVAFGILLGAVLGIVLGVILLFFGDFFGTKVGTAISSCLPCLEVNLCEGIGGILGSLLGFGLGDWTGAAVGSFIAGCF